MCLALEAQPLLASEDTIDPPFFIGCFRVQIGENLRQTPESFVFANAFIDQKPSERIAATSGEKNHRLVDSIKNGVPSPVSAEEGREAVRVLNMIVDKLTEPVLSVPPAVAGE